MTANAGEGVGWRKVGVWRKARSSVSWSGKSSAEGGLALAAEGAGLDGAATGGAADAEVDAIWDRGRAGCGRSRRL